MARGRRKKKQRRQSGDNNDDNDGHRNNNNNNASSFSSGSRQQNLVLSIEEELKQQRIRQRQREEKEQRQRQIEMEMKDTEQEQYDFHDLSEEHDQNGTGDTRIGINTGNSFQSGKTNTSLVKFIFEKQSRNLNSVPSQMLSYMGEVSTRSTRNNRSIRIRQHGSYLLENMVINAKGSSLYDPKMKWHTHSLPDGRVTNTMLTCKHRLHPSARTFDVVSELHSASSLSSSTTMSSLPTISTIVQGGWAIFQPNLSESTPRGRPPRGSKLNRGMFHTIRCPPVHSLRIHESSGRMGAIVRPSHRSLSNKFHIYPLQSSASSATTYIEATLPQPANDFCFGKDLALFACPRFRSSSEPILPIFLHLEHGSTASSLSSSPFRSLDVQNFCQSDALRVEMNCNRSDKSIAFGHRNGQVSLIDLRAPRAVCTILQHETSSSSSSSSGITSSEGRQQCPLGSVTDLAFLGNHNMNQNYILVKRSFGSCQLHDVRMSSNISRGHHHHGLGSSSSSSSQTFLRNLSVPAEFLNATKSQNCNGFALDGTAKMLFSTYLHANGDACVGVWSLQTGDMIGSRTVLPAGKCSTDVLFMEMSQQLTPSYDHERNGGPRTNSGCGMWLKCGSFTGGAAVSSKAGNLYHISIPGRWSP